MHEIRYAPEFDKGFGRLREKALKGDGEARYLIGIIGKASTKIAQNREAGKKIPRNLWPREYIQKYGIKNLWKFNLDSYWRLVYTITGDQARLFLIYLEYMNHKEYDRKFGYRRG